MSQAASAQPQSVSAIRTLLSCLPNNAPVDVKLNDGRKLRGRFGTVTEEAFILRSSRNSCRQRNYSVLDREIGSA